MNAFPDTDWGAPDEVAASAWRSIVEPPVTAVDPAQSESLILGIIAKTPWWLISLGAHALLALLAGLFWAASNLEDVEMIVMGPPRPPRQIPDMDWLKELDPNKKILDVKKQVEDPVYRKNAEVSDHNETADEEEFQKAKGDSEDFVSDRPFRSRATYDVIGGGGGGGGRYGTRLGGKMNLATQGGGGRDTEDAVLAALKWLARHQSSDGSWSPTKYTKRCNRIGKYRSGGRCTPERGDDRFTSGVTGLALLAFLGAGYSHLSRQTYDGISFGDVVRDGIQWLIKHQDGQGCVGGRSGHYMYNHTICALALCEAYGLTGSSIFKEEAQKAIDFIVDAQNPGMAWRYSARCGDNDTSVTGWAVMALKSAEISDLDFPRSAYTGARKWLDHVTDYGTGCAGYTGKNDFENRRAMTAVSIMSRIFIVKEKADPRLYRGSKFILLRKPQWKKKEIDFYYWYYASLALFQFDGPGGPQWKSWNQPMKNTLLKNQVRSSKHCKDGCWEPEGRWCGGGGRAYATAINALTLEVYYRYANVFGAR